ncbi:MULTISPECIES: transposase [unclassified Streptomyces]|uniref:transposase n=1 Tax=unclassified Streptomyces TaxID=2593676 RepID=UPI0036FBF3FC
MAEPRRPPGGGGAGGEGLGRSRGGFTSKVHPSADGRCRPLSLVTTPGQRADCTQLKPVLEKIRVPGPGPGRPHEKPDSLTADKAYGNRPCREHLRRRGVRHTIPEKTDSQVARLRKGSRGGLPQPRRTRRRCSPRHHAGPPATVIGRTAPRRRQSHSGLTNRQRDNAARTPGGTGRGLLPEGKDPGGSAPAARVQLQLLPFEACAEVAVVRDRDH